MRNKRKHPLRAESIKKPAGNAERAKGRKLALHAADAVLDALQTSKLRIISESAAENLISMGCSI